jgi:glycosyltransferase involved in cell wall biosynthesis
VSLPVLHQVMAGASPGDAITDQALVIRRWLREMGFVSDLYAEHVHETLLSEVQPLAAYRPGRQEKWAVLHHSIGSAAVEVLARQDQRLILIYHNVTPPEFFAQIDPAWAERMRRGQAQLAALRSQTALALADSAFNEQELVTAGFTSTGVLPITLDERLYHLPVEEEPWEQVNGKGPLLLFVGRLAPNKKQEDLIRLLFYVRRIQPAAQLTLVGDRWLLGYDRWLERLAQSLGLGEAVILTGRVSQKEMVAHYRAADLYVSMSEHEGFGKPLIESMYLGLPIMAYESTAVPYTLGDAGVLFRKKDYEALAEMVDILCGDQALRRRIVERQRARVQAFLEPQVRKQLADSLDSLGLL